MKIIGDRKKVTEIELNLYSVNTRFKCLIRPFYRAGQIGLEEPNTAVITFDDSKEIDLLIGMLERFRDQNARYMGNWKQEG